VKFFSIGIHLISYQHITIIDVLLTTQLNTIQYNTIFLFGIYFILFRYSLRGRYDDDRQIAYEILRKFPAPIPGYETPQRLIRLMKTVLEWLSRYA
jgi:hypothetical protein